MKNYALYILIYNLLSVMLCSTDWVRERVTYFGITSERYNFINIIDIPFYVIALAVLLFYNVRLNKMQLTYFFTATTFLVFKWFNFDVGYYMFFVWNYVILSIPLFVWLESKINYDRFSK